MEKKIDIGIRVFFIFPLFGVEYFIEANLSYLECYLESVPGSSSCCFKRRFTLFFVLPLLFGF